MKRNNLIHGLLKFCQQQSSYLTLYVLYLLSVAVLSGIYSCSRPELPKPTEVQYKWHEQERLMFIHFAPTTWSEVEQNDHSVPLERINPARLDTDQWCQAAMAWGARQIIFVAKHTGGFCWWQTETTDYGIRNTPYQDGKGDVLKELSASCKKYGLNLGVYIYPGDRTWGAAIGSGGKTNDPDLQEAYNQVFRTQLKEVLTKYGQMMEVWFDGSCVIDISDIMQQYAHNSVVFQGPHATIRWPGTESGKLFYPAWNTVRSEDLKTGVSTQVHGYPEGDTWAPLETNTTLYDHYWFWSPRKQEKRKSVDQLMECYYRSVGYGSVFLLNASPDTTGLIPEADVIRYKEFGDEIERRFKTPVGELSNETGKKVTLKLSEPKKINHIITMEDYREGERIREYKIEGLVNGTWMELVRGISVGRKKIDYFDEVEVSAVRLHITRSAARPLIRSLAAYYVEDFKPSKKEEGLRVWARPVEVGNWNEAMYSEGKVQMEIDLSDRINVPGQYTLQVLHEGEVDVAIEDPALYYKGTKALNEFITVSGNKININQTAQITERPDIKVSFSIVADAPTRGNIVFQPASIY